jgi:hypothetical protein
VTRGDRNLTAPRALAKLRAEKEHRATLALVQEKLERTLEALAADLTEEAIDCVIEALALLELA